VHIIPFDNQVDRDHTGDAGGGRGWRSLRSFVTVWTMKKILLLALAWPLLVVWAFSFIASRIEGQPFLFRELLAGRLFESVLAAAPFVALYYYARARRRRQRHWRAGMLAAGALMTAGSLMLWGGLLMYRLSSGAGAGVKYVLGAALLASPLLLPLLMPLGYRLGRSYAARNATDDGESS
jgi:hypothetical protein